MSEEEKTTEEETTEEGKEKPSEAAKLVERAEKAAAAQKERYADYKSHATQIMRDRIDIFNYYNERKLAFDIKDLYEDDGTPSGTSVTLYVPLEFRTRN